MAVMPDMHSLVKVICLHNEPDFLIPGKMKKSYRTISTGIILEDHKILTTADSVLYSTVIKIVKYGSSTLYLGSVLHSGIDCNLALLTVTEQPIFWEAIKEIAISQNLVLPSTEDVVFIFEHESFNHGISITTSLIMDARMLSYSPDLELLGFKIKKELNHSGAPAFNNDGKFVGMACQRSSSMGCYIMPAEVINHFIEDIKKNGVYNGFPSFAAKWQRIENPELKNAMNMAWDQNGILITKVEPTSSLSTLKSHDVILSLDDVAIPNNGLILNGKNNIRFDYAVTQKYIGDTCKLIVLRGARLFELEFKLEKLKKLVPLHTREKPDYYIFGGLVFTALSFQYLIWKRATLDFNVKESIVQPLEKHLYEMRKFDDQQIVVISQVLGAEINKEYEHINKSQVHTINGDPVRNLKNLVETVENSTSEYLIFEVDNKEEIVLQRELTKEATPAILTDYGITSPVSQNLVPQPSLGEWSNEVKFETHLV